MAKKDEAAAKRSAAAKKAAATRKANEEKAQQEEVSQETPVESDPQGAALESVARSVEPTEAQRDADREAEIRRHNARSGGGEVREGEIKAAREEHNERANTN